MAADFWPEHLKPSLECYREMLTLGDRIAEIAGKGLRSQGETERLLLQLFAKLLGTSRASLVLADQGMIEHALSLHRNLLEGTINVAFAVKTGLEESMIRYNDWLSWEWVRRVKATDYDRGTERYSAKLESRLRALESDLEARYSEKDLKNLARHGPFKGDLKYRAAEIGWEARYETSYRTLSRNVHSVDVVELGAVVAEWPLKIYAEMMEVRYRLICDEGMFCVGPMVGLMDDYFGAGLANEFKAATEKFLELRSVGKADDHSE